MSIFDIFKRRKSEKNQTRFSNQTRLSGENLLTAFLSETQITEYEAMNIPAVSQCVNLISDTISTIPIKLYKSEENQGRKRTVEVLNDIRTVLLNDDTQDTFDGVQFKRAMVRDYLIYGNSYAYINKKRNKFVSINYVPCRNVSVLFNNNPIFKDFDIMVLGNKYKPFEFLKILKSTENGASGRGLLAENSELLSIAYLILKFDQNLVSTGGTKKGFLTSKNRLSTEAMTALKSAWRNLYSNNEENVIILNDGLEFKESSQSSVEMQLNQRKTVINNEIRSIFNIPEGNNYELFIKNAVTPILTAIECALNRDFLLEKEKKSLYFAFDTKEIIKGDIKTRFEAYKTALDSNLMQIDECRFMEDLEPLGLNFIKLGLQDVLYNPQTKEIFTPNTGQTQNIGDDLENNVKLGDD